MGDSWFPHLMNTIYHVNPCVLTGVNGAEDGPTFRENRWPESGNHGRPERLLSRKWRKSAIEMAMIFIEVRQGSIA